MSKDDNNGNLVLTALDEYCSNRYHREHIFHYNIPTDFDIYRLQKFDIVLGFASEHYTDDGKGTGLFNPTWKLDPASIQWLKNLKDDYPNATVIISIGGFDTKRPFNPSFPFNPVEKHEWIVNTVKSIKRIIHLYDYDDIHRRKNVVDGIDFHFGTIKTSEDEFSYCIGEVIKLLKKDANLSINVVSIAVIEHFESYYLKLYLDNQDIIDVVDLFFYGKRFSTTQEYIEFHQKIVADYAPAIVTPGL
jgi:hypothetical protein